MNPGANPSSPCGFWQVKPPVGWNEYQHKIYAIYPLGLKFGGYTAQWQDELAD
jgi:hypothetical protein